MNGISLASRLQGKIIDSKWEVLEKREKTAEDPSGAFSSCYNVRNIHTGSEAFLKAFNYPYAFTAIGQKSSPDLLKELTSNYVYERELLLFCKERKMSRVVTAIDHGQYREDGEFFDVPYLIFEIASESLKNYKRLENPDLAWKLGSFHGFLVGLSQIHNQKIVHQDIKPSNILVFGNNVTKLSDLGNATQFNNESPMWDKPEHCGACHYAPIELLYNYFSPDWNVRRLGADLYMAGGILTYLITDSIFLWLMGKNLPKIFHPNEYGGTYENLKPHLMKAYFQTLDEIEKIVPKKIKQDFVEVLSQLCHPIPEVRGNPPGLRATVSQYSLHRYISIIDRLAKTMEYIKK